MLFEPEPTGGSFESDITTGATQTAGDPIFGGGRGGSDYGAFDRCLDAGGAELMILKPVDGGTFQSGSSVPFDVKVLKNGVAVTDAVDPPNGMSLYILHNESGTFYFEPQPTPGGSSAFFKKRGGYGANFDTSGKPLGLYIAGITSTNAEGTGAGLFATGCVNFSLAAGKKK
jgi:hypothetical protein